MKFLIAHMVAIALLTVIPGTPSECCRMMSWDVHSEELEETSRPSCCHPDTEVALASNCCGSNESQHQQPFQSPCDCCYDAPTVVVPISASEIDLKPNVSLIDQVCLADDSSESTIARLSSIDESPPIAFTELYCVRRE